MRYSVLLLVLAAAAASGLEELWTYDLPAGCDCLPVAFDCTGDGLLETVLTTRHDGRVWIIGSQGELVGRFARDNWIEGGAAVAIDPLSEGPLIAFQETSGALDVFDYRASINRWTPLPGKPEAGAAPCFGDLNRDGVSEIAVARSDGVVTALDLQLRPLWQFAAQPPFNAPPAVAPVFENAAAVYVQNVRGTLFCLRGDGLPMWRFQMSGPGTTQPASDGPLVVQLVKGTPSVLVSDQEGWLYAINAVTGAEQWRLRAGATSLGVPAIFDVTPQEGREIVAVDAHGAVCVVDPLGKVIQTARLPRADYIPRPLVADIDGDGVPDILAADGNCHVVIASLDGRVKETVLLDGDAPQGVMLADLDADGRLELVAPTECGTVQCFRTRATHGWTHPLTGAGLNKVVPPLSVSAAQPRPAARKSVRVDSMAAVYPREDHPFGSVALRLNWPRGAHSAMAVARHGEVIAGAALQQLAESSTRRADMLIPFVLVKTGERLVMDLVIFDASGAATAVTRGIEVESPAVRPVNLTAPDAFRRFLEERGAAYRASDAWELPKVEGWTFWHVVDHMPKRWEHYGLAQEPFIREAVPQIWAPADEHGEKVFGPAHPAWDAIRIDDKPFFIQNGATVPEKPYPGETAAAIRGMARDRFLGFTVHERLGPMRTNSDLGRGSSGCLGTQNMTELKTAFDMTLNRCNGRVHLVQNQALLHHQAFSWGAHSGAATVAGDVACAPLRFAFARGASRQFGSKPWGINLSNWFCDSIASTFGAQVEQRFYQGDRCIFAGSDCGHSVSLEMRLALAGYLAGVTFAHHEPSSLEGSLFVEHFKENDYAISPYGRVMRALFALSRLRPDRGTPFTPVGLLMDFNCAWRPENPMENSPQSAGEGQAIAAFFQQIYGWDGRVDFERGHLTSGPYGDMFDVLTYPAAGEILRKYAVLWPVGPIGVDAAFEQALRTYVAQGGVLVVESTLGQSLSRALLGLEFRKHAAYATQMQTALSEMPVLDTPFKYLPMRSFSRDVEVLASTETGDPLLAWRPYGLGAAVVSGCRQWVDERGSILPLAGVLLRAFSEAYLPVTTSSDVELLVNRNAEGWVIGLVNNKGVSKVPTEPGVLDYREAQECILKLRGRIPLRFTPWLGRFRWSNYANGLITNIQPGDAAIVALVLSQPREKDE